MKPNISEVNKDEDAHPTQALDTDVVGIRSTRRAINDPVPELIVGRAACHPAEQLTPVFHQDCQRGGDRDKYLIPIETYAKLIF